MPNDFDVNLNSSLKDFFNSSDSDSSAVSNNTQTENNLFIDIAALNQINNANDKATSAGISQFGGINSEDALAALEQANEEVLISSGSTYEEYGYENGNATRIVYDYEGDGEIDEITKYIRDDEGNKTGIEYTYYKNGEITHVTTATLDESGKSTQQETTYYENGDVSSNKVSHLMITERKFKLNTISTGMVKSIVHQNTNTTKMAI